MIFPFPTVSGKSFKIPWFQSPPTVVFSQPLAWILAWPRPRTESAHTSKRHLGWGRQIPGKSAGIVADWILRGFSWSPLKYYSLVMCFLQFANWKMAIEIVDLPVFHSYVSLPVGSISAKKSSIFTSPVFQRGNIMQLWKKHWGTRGQGAGLFWFGWYILAQARQNPQETLRQVFTMTPFRSAPADFDHPQTGLVDSNPHLKSGWWLSHLPTWKIWEWKSVGVTTFPTV